MDDKSAVDAIIAEAMDACALDQIAKLNTAHLSSSSDSSLPSDLESRFRKLKSFPTRTVTTAASPAVTATRSLNFGKENNAPPAPAPAPAPAPSVPIVGTGFTGGDEGMESTSPVVTCGEKVKRVETQSEVKVGSGVQSGDGVESKKTSSADSGSGSGFSPSKRRGPQPDPSPLDRLGCCFFLSPKKATSTTKSKQKDGNGGSIYGMDLGAVELDELSNNKTFLADIKEQQKKLKKALKEQEKVSREAAKLVRYARHASARMRANTDELFSDDDEDELSGTHFH